MSPPEEEAESATGKILAQSRLSRRINGLVALSALATLQRFDEFEERLQAEVEAGLAPWEAHEMLLELADLGVNVSARSFEAVNRLS